MGSIERDIMARNEQTTPPDRALSSPFGMDMVPAGDRDRRALSDRTVVETSKGVVPFGVDIVEAKAAGDIDRRVWPEEGRRGGRAQSR